MTKVYWNKNYYDLLEFYLNEPQHIAPKSTSDAQKRRTVIEAVKRLRRLETPLNHIFSIFFRLAPPDFVPRLIAAAFDGAKVNPDFESVGREADQKFDLRNFTQPDLMFVGSDAIVCIEMKVDAKTDAEQIFKYAALLAHVDPGGAKRRFLIYMGPRDFAWLWRPKKITIEAAKEMASDFARNLPKKLKGALFIQNISNIETVIDNMRLGYQSYTDVRQLLESEMTRATAPDGVYRRLLEGLATEIADRGF